MILEQNFDNLNLRYRFENTTEHTFSESKKMIT